MNLDRFIGALGRWPPISALARVPRVRAVLERIPLMQSLYSIGWERIHPFDRANRTDTSGVVGSGALPEHEPARMYAVSYAGCQPSVLRAALALLPPAGDFTFLDLGCGKGRALLVASERPFKDVVGVELSVPLAKIARSNATRVARAHPQRTAIRVATGDASDFPLPDGDLVIFLYNPFGPELVARVAAQVEAALRVGGRRIFVVYCTPVAPECFDAVPGLKRRYAGDLPFAPEEIGFGPGEADAVVIWESPATKPGQ